jgi:hypothetical protein
MASGRYLWEMSLTVFVRRDLLGGVSQVRRGTLACGVAGVAGNKGGICVSLCVHQTSVLFISSHLAAFQNDVDNRNRCISACHITSRSSACLTFELRDYRTISTGLKVNPLEPGVESCESHHCCIWMGDLNYRCSGVSFCFEALRVRNAPRRIDMKREDVVAAVERRDWPLLQAEDQLIKARQTGHAFAHYSEALLDFPPTYRYHKGVTPRTHAAYNDEKLRIPAWCDRVLWRTWENVSLQPKLFNCVDAITTSDHSPVHAAFDLTYALPLTLQPKSGLISLQLRPHAAADTAASCQRTRIIHSDCRRPACQQHQRAGRATPFKLHRADCVPVCTGTGGTLASLTAKPQSRSNSPQVDSVFGGMLKSSKQHVERGDVAWADKFSVMLAPHSMQYVLRYIWHFLLCCVIGARYTQHQHVIFKLREVIKPYKKIIGFAAVSLHGAALASERDKATAFMVPLRLQGLVCGMRCNMKMRCLFACCSRRPVVGRDATGKAEAGQSVRC